VILDDGAQYIYGAGLVAQISGANTYYYLADGLGSTMKTVDNSGAVVNAYTYDVYGKTATASGAQANEFQFAGEQTDPSGLQYLRARYYDTDTGRFMSRDPLASGTSWTEQPYGYAAGNPVNSVDPLGLVCIWGVCADRDGVSVDNGNDFWQSQCYGQPLTSDPCLGRSYGGPPIQLNSCWDICHIFVIGEYRGRDVEIKVNPGYRDEFVKKGWTPREVARVLLDPDDVWRQPNGIRAFVKELDGLYYVLARGTRGIVGGAKGLTKEELDEYAALFKWIGYFLK
jgi:RHS repeat-associated protein